MTETCYNPVAPNYTVVSVFGPDCPMWITRQHKREDGCHVSDIIKPIAIERLGKHFKPMEQTDPERLEREINHYTKGLVLEEAWGAYFAEMLNNEFERPEPRQDEGIWGSPDGYHSFGPRPVPPDIAQSWPEAYPTLTGQAIHECKVTLKSGNQETSPITHDKFVPWVWQVMAYCYLWRSFTAYIHVLHLCGDYKDRPYTPMGAVHRFDFDAPTLAAHWKWLVDEAKERGLLRTGS